MVVWLICLFCSVLFCSVIVLGREEGGGRVSCEVFLFGGEEVEESPVKGALDRTEFI